MIIFLPKTPDMSNILYVKNSLIFNYNGELIKDADITKFQIEAQCLSEQRNTYVALSKVPNLSFSDKEWILQKMEQSDVELSDETICLNWITFPATSTTNQEFPSNYVNWNGIILRNMKKPVILTRAIFPVLINNSLNLNSIITTPEKLFKSSTSLYVSELIDKQICLSLLSVMHTKYFEKDYLQDFCSRFALRLDDINIKLVLSKHKMILYKNLLLKNMSLEEILKLLSDLNDDSYEAALQYLLTTEIDIPEIIVAKVHDQNLYKEFLCKRKIFDAQHMIRYESYKDPQVLKCALNSLSMDPTILDMLDEQTVKLCITEIAHYCEVTGKDFTPSLLSHINSLCEKENINNNDLYSIIRTVLMSSDPNHVEILSGTLYASCIYHVLANIIDSDYNEEKLSYLDIAKLLCKYSKAEIKISTTPKNMLQKQRAVSPERRYRLGSSASPEPDDDSEPIYRRTHIKPKFNDKFKPTLEVIRNFFEPSGTYAFMTLYHIAIKRGKHLNFSIELCPEPVSSLNLIEFAHHYQVVLPRNRVDIDLYKVDLKASESGVPVNSICVYEFPFAGNDCYVITTKNLKEDMSRRVYVSKSKTDAVLLKASRSEFIRKHTRSLPDEHWRSESANSPRVYLAVSRSDVTLEALSQFLDTLN